MDTMIARDEIDVEEMEEETEDDARSARGVLPRFRRAPLDVPFALTRRDVAILRDVWHYRLLTTSQLETLRRADDDATLRFVSRLTLTRRLKGLFHHRYVRRIVRPRASGSQEPVYVLDREGARALVLVFEDENEAETVIVEVRAPVPSRLPRAQGLDHLLLITQARVAFAATTAGVEGDDEEQLQLLEWKSSEAAHFRVEVEVPGVRRAAHKQSVTLRPDAGMVVRVTSHGKRARHVAFLEMDRGTEPLATLVFKARAYYAFWKSGGFEGAYHAPSGAGFWVLFCMPSKARATSLLKALRGVEGGLTMFRVGLECDLLPERVAGAVWTEAGQGALVKPCQWIGQEKRNL